MLTNSGGKSANFEEVVFNVISGGVWRSRRGDKCVIVKTCSEMALVPCLRLRAIICGRSSAAIPGSSDRVENPTDDWESGHFEEKEGLLMSNVIDSMTAHN